MRKATHIYDIVLQLELLRMIYEMHYSVHLRANNKVCIAVVLNRGAAEPLGATESYRGAPISEVDWYLLVKCHIVKKLRKSAANQNRLRNTGV